MKLQKQKAYEYKGKEHYKYTIVVPENLIKKLEWDEGLELNGEVDRNSLKIRPYTRDEKALKEEQPLYSDFKETIEKLLKRFPIGLTWLEIKEKLNFPQKVPNNKWVKQLESDIGLKRIKIENKTIWKLENDTFFTIGYEGRNIGDFIERLLDYNIEQLMDIREIAFSRKNSFSKGMLMSYLKEAGIRYKHFSSLGSPKDIRDILHKDWNYKKFFEEYQKHIDDEDVKEELRDIEGLSKMRRTAIMCFEREPSRCHRSIVSNELKEKGWKIVDIK